MQWAELRWSNGYLLLRKYTAGPRNMSVWYRWTNGHRHEFRHSPRDSARSFRKKNVVKLDLDQWDDKLVKWLNIDNRTLVSLDRARVFLRGAWLILDHFKNLSSDITENPTNAEVKEERRPMHIRDPQNLPFCAGSSWMREVEQGRSWRPA